MRFPLACSVSKRILRKKHEIKVNFFLADKRLVCKDVNAAARAHLGSNDYNQSGYVSRLARKLVSSTNNSESEKNTVLRYEEMKKAFCEFKDDRFDKVINIIVTN